MLKTTLTICIVFMCCATVKAQYADLGTGGQKDKIWWLDWSGFTMAENASRSFTTTDGLNVTVTLTNVSAEILYPSVMKTWRGALFYNLYDFSNTAIQPALYSRESYNPVSFNMQFTVTRNGVPVPFSVVTADAEASTADEVTTLTTDGSNWGTIDFYRTTSFSTNPITGCNTNKVVMAGTYGGAIGLGQIPLLQTTGAAGSMTLNVSFTKLGVSGAMGVTFGIFSPIDRGDLPAAYGYAQHRLSYDKVNSCNYTAPLPSLTQYAGLCLGQVVGDADGIQTTNDNATGVDEDAIAGFPVYDKSGTYALTVPVKNTTGADAWLTGWFDNNNNEVFETSELVTAKVAANATSVSLQWTGVPAVLTTGVNYAFRFRLSSDKAATLSATGFASDGEVEDYQARLDDGVLCDNWMYTSDASNTIGVSVGDVDVSGSTITVEALFNQTLPFVGAHTTCDLVSKHSSIYNDNYLLRNTSASLTTSNGFYSVSSPCGTDLNKTQHYAMVYDGATLKYYKNGFLIAQTPCTGTLVNNDLPAMIGNVYAAEPGPEGSRGYINEVRIWNVARTQEQIRANMSVTLSNPSAQAGLLGYYTFDNLINKQGNTAYNGQIMGSAVIGQTNPQCSISTDSCGYVKVTAGFTAPDTVCVNTPVTVANLSENATSYYWNFNSASLDTRPATVNMGNIGGLLNMPVYSDIAEENGNYYVFVVDHHIGTLIRLDFGNSLLNTPTATDLGKINGVLPADMEGIQVVKNEGKWYAVIVGGNPDVATSFILKISFGASIANASPVATNWGNIGGLSFPIDLHLFKDGDSWYGLTVNQRNNTLTRFSFSGSFENTPTGVNLGGFGGALNGPAGICCVKQNNDWYAFITNDAPVNGLVRLYFGTSLLNLPTATVLPDAPLLNHLRDVYIMPYCDGWYGFAVNGTTNELLQLYLGKDVTNVPVITNYGNVGSLSFPHSLSKMFRVGGDLYSFIPNVNNNTITRVRYSSSVVVNGAISTLANPASVTYSTAGTYNISLVADETLGTQVSYCKSIVVLDVPGKVPVIDSMFCADSVVVLSRFRVTTPGMMAAGLIR